MGGGKIQECREINRNRPWNDDVTKSDIYLHVEPDLPNMGYERDTDAPILILKANGLGSHGGWLEAAAVIRHLVHTDVLDDLLHLILGQHLPPHQIDIDRRTRQGCIPEPKHECPP